MYANPNISNGRLCKKNIIYLVDEDMIEPRSAPSSKALFIVGRIKNKEDFLNMI